jgi:hypothetical protein
MSAFQESYTQNARRLNGVNQQSFVVPSLLWVRVRPTAAQLIASASVYNLLNNFRCVSGGPTNCAATIPSVAGFSAQQQAIYGIATNIQAPTMYLMGVQVERQLPRNVTATVGFFQCAQAPRYSSARYKRPVARNDQPDYESDRAPGRIRLRFAPNTPAPRIHAP